ncbi:ATP-binding protein [Sphingomonas sp. CJ20]
MEYAAIESKRALLLELLAANAADMLGATNIRAALERMFEMLNAGINIDIFFHYRQEEGEGLVLETHGGITAREASAALHMQLSEALCDTVTLDCEPIRLTNIQQSPDPKTAFLQAMGIDSYCCLPLTHGGRLLGTLGFGRRAPGGFDDQEYSFLQTLASYVALCKHRLGVERALRAGVAERDRLLAEQREMEQKVIELTRVSALGAVAATIAHELNQPLSAAANYVSAIRLDPNIEPSRVAERARAAEKELLRAGEIIRRIRRMVSREGLSLEAENVEPIVNESIGLVKAAVGGTLPTFRVAIGPRAERVVIDHVQIVQVLANLLRNAIQATQDMASPMVSVQTRRINEDEVQFRITDNGPGVPREVRTAIFQPRLGLSRSGLGLGLAISRNLIEAHGGTIQVEDAPGGGASFCFTVPALHES